MNMELNEYFKRIFDPALEYYTQVIHRVENRFDRPQLVEVNGIPQWRYTKLTVEHMCLLRGVRIISAFNSIRSLLNNGYVQEISVLLRTIDEFQEDIVFLIENYSAKELSAQQKKFLEEMGKEEYFDPNHPFATQIIREPPIRKKIKAAGARFLSPVMNPSDSQKISQIGTDCLSGYMHGAYPQIMELYGGPPPTSRFHLTGMLGTPRMDVWMRTVAMYLQRTGPTLGFMCHAFEMENEVQCLRHMKNWFVKELQESLGCDMDYTPEGILKKIKEGKGQSSGPGYLPPTVGSA
ncbi:MAG: hypothetical protein WC299_06805 [Kiritimatiellia bacterium]